MVQGDSICQQRRQDGSISPFCPFSVSDKHIPADLQEPGIHSTDLVMMLAWACKGLSRDVNKNVVGWPHTRPDSYI